MGDYERLAREMSLLAAAVVMTGTDLPDTIRSTNVLPPFGAKLTDEMTPVPRMSPGRAFMDEVAVDEAELDGVLFSG